MNFIYDLLLSYGLNETLSKYIYYAILILILFFLCFVISFIINKVILKILAKRISKNKYRWDDIMLENRVFKRILNIIPGIIIYNIAPLFDEFSAIFVKLTLTYILILIVLLGQSLLKSAEDIYSAFPISRVKPIKGLLQVIEIAFYIIMGILTVSTLIDKSPIVLLSGIGALTAVTSLIFKDSIVNFVAGIQLTWNDLLRIDDWIEVSKHNADGTVVEISLNTVKVQNFDKSISTIPTYDLIAGSFRNWRGMSESGGRRLKRSINIDVSSIKFLSKEKIEEFKKINYIKEYIMQEEKLINEYNQKIENSEILINGRNLSNIGAFRVYIQNYLNNHPKIHKGMTSMVRQLAPTESGLPIEIYVFVSDTKWTVYESVQSEIFEHLLSIVDTFELRIYQKPTSYDFK